MEGSGKRERDSPMPPQPVKRPRLYLDDLMNIKITALARLVWGEKFDQWQRLNTRQNSKGQSVPPSARSIFELSGAGTQCANTIGPLDDSTFDRSKNKWSGTPCYVCGGVIVKLPEDKVAARAVAKGDPAKLIGLKGQCEHVLSIAQAVLLYFLYNGGDKPLLNKEANREFFSREYRWAHNICNQEKGDMQLIKYDHGNFQINDANVSFLLNKIYDSGRTSATILRSMLRIENVARKEIWKEKRMAAIALDLADMVQYLNEQNRGNMMMLLAAVNVLERVQVDFKDVEPVVTYEDPEFDVEDSMPLEVTSATTQALATLGAPPDAPPIDEIDNASSILLSMKSDPTVATRTGRISSPPPKFKGGKTRRHRLPKLL